MKIAVVIPTYNEKKNIAPLIKRIFNLKIKGLEIIVVDDNSPDGTGEEAEKLARRFKAVEVIHRKEKSGLGSAYKAGFRRVLKDGASVVVTMDADLSHDPLVIPKMLTKLKEADIVVGSRYVKDGKILGFSWWRKFLSNSGQLSSRVFLGNKVFDSTSGFRAYKAEVLKKIGFTDIKSEGYSFLIEAIYRCHTRGFKIAEVPIVFKMRAQGVSKLSQAEIVKAAVTVLRLKLSPTK